MREFIAKLNLKTILQILILPAISYVLHIAYRKNKFIRTRLRGLGSWIGKLLDIILDRPPKPKPESINETPSIQDNGKNIETKCPEFTEQYQAQRQKLKSPTIFVCGYSRSGKKSLIDAVFSRVVQAEVDDADSELTQDYVGYLKNDLVIWKSQNWKPERTDDAFEARIKDFFQEKRTDEGSLIWFTIPSDADSLKYEKTFLKNIFNPAKDIVVITKCDLKDKKKAIKILRKEIMTCNVPKDRIIETNEQPEGYDKLASLTLASLAEPYKDVFADEQTRRTVKIEMIKSKRKAVDADAIIKNAIDSASANIKSSISISNINNFFPIQFGMIGKLAALFGLDDEMQRRVKSRILPDISRVDSLLHDLIPKYEGKVNAKTAKQLTKAIGLYAKESFQAAVIGKIEGKTDKEIIEFDKALFKKCYTKAQQGLLDKLKAHVWKRRASTEKSSASK